MKPSEIKLTLENNIFKVVFPLSEENYETMQKLIEGNLDYSWGNFILQTDNQNYDLVEHQPNVQTTGESKDFMLTVGVESHNTNMPYLKFQGIQTSDDPDDLLDGTNDDKIITDDHDDVTGKPIQLPELSLTDRLRIAKEYKAIMKIIETVKEEA